MSIRLVIFAIFAVGALIAMQALIGSNKDGDLTKSTNIEVADE